MKPQSSASTTKATTGATATFRANGKLLLTGEYVVLDGAVALALPTHLGQEMVVRQGDGRELVWESLDHQGRVWFRGAFSVPHGEYLGGMDDGVGKTLEQMWRHILSVKPGFLADKDGMNITTRLEFPRDWGLGSSSTMIHNLAQWAGVDAFDLSENSLGGSGYDIACAGAEGPILYQVQPSGKPHTKTAKFNPHFRGDLYFVHLGRKQNSRSGIRHYRRKAKENPQVINNISIITHRMMGATTISEFQALAKHHEKIISKLLDMEMVKRERFPDYWGMVKSLGAWGGDFALVTSEAERDATAEYFKQKGYPIFFSYDEMIR